MSSEPVNGPILLTTQDMEKLRLVGAILNGQWQQYLQVNLRKISMCLMWLYRIAIRLA